jgi:hypothetical protein
MNKRIGLSYLAAAVVAVGLASPAAAFNGTEEDAAVPHGSFVSTMPVPAKIENVAYVAQPDKGQHRNVVVVNSEEDLAAPRGSFVSTMPVPNANIKELLDSAVSENDAVSYDDLALATLGEQVAAALE